jgi:hypothetical protein
MVPSPHLRSEAAIIAGMAAASLPGSRTPWADYAGDYDLIRDKMAEAIEDFNRRVRQPLGFRLKQPARELVFLTKTGRAEFSAAPLAGDAPAPGRLLLGTMRSHDQWNTAIYSDNDRYRGVKNLRTLVFMNRDDMRGRGLQKYDLVDITSFAKDGSTRGVRGYRAIPYDLPRGSAMGYMPELNVLCPIGAGSTTPSGSARAWRSPTPWRRGRPRASARGPLTPTGASRSGSTPRMPRSGSPASVWASTTSRSSTGASCACSWRRISRASTGGPARGTKTPMPSPTRRLYAIPSPIETFLAEETTIRIPVG